MRRRGPLFLGGHSAPCGARGVSLCVVGGSHVVLDRHINILISLQHTPHISQFKEAGPLLPTHHILSPWASSGAAGETTTTRQSQSPPSSSVVSPPTPSVPRPQLARPTLSVTLCADNTRPLRSSEHDRSHTPGSGGGLFARLFGRKRAPDPINVSAAARRRSGAYDRDGRQSPAVAAPAAAPLYAKMATTLPPIETTPVAAMFAASSLPPRTTSEKEAPPPLPPKPDTANAAAAAIAPPPAATPRATPAPAALATGPVSASADAERSQSPPDESAASRVASPAPRPASAADTLAMNRPLSFSPDLLGETRFSLPPQQQPELAAVNEVTPRVVTVSSVPSGLVSDSTPTSPLSATGESVHSLPGAPILRSAVGSITMRNVPAVTRHSMIPSHGGKRGSTTGEGMFDQADAPPVPALGVDEPMSKRMSSLLSHGSESEASFGSAPPPPPERAAAPAILSNEEDVVASPIDMSPSSARPVSMLPTAIAVPVVETVVEQPAPAEETTPVANDDLQVDVPETPAVTLSFEDSPLSPLSLAAASASAESQAAKAVSPTEAAPEAVEVEPEAKIMETTAMAIDVFPASPTLASPTSSMSARSRLSPPQINVGSYADFDANHSLSDLPPSPISPGDTPIVTPEFKANTALPVKPELPPKDLPVVPPKDTPGPSLVTPPARSASVRTPTRNTSLRRSGRDAAALDTQSSADANLPPVSGKFPASLSKTRSVSGQAAAPSSTANTPQRARTLTPRRAVTSPSTAPSSPGGEEAPNLDDFMGLFKTVISREKGMSIRDAAKTAEKFKEMQAAQAAES
ncbi:uncharacterized protein EHS24_009570 [Apiotrichum porosum]|uniref:Uncharacterized protein n=1 Tax=Apiotrichum porosum TaxID=105984 RepID=A0A427XMA7_9TREE|nr:uncharacterized protein EHS24_009570 [Apiotrichum porosum]RSH79902.1 hypothetical protein EHS24_009570 [Apiotrichum porosum]